MKYRELMVGVFAGVGMTVCIGALAQHSMPLFALDNAWQKAPYANEMVLFEAAAGVPSVLSIATSADGERVYVATAGGIFRSDDGGVLWHRLPVR